MNGGHNKANKTGFESCSSLSCYYLSSAENCKDHVLEFLWISVFISKNIISFFFSVCLLIDDNIALKGLVHAMLANFFFILLEESFIFRITAT